MVQRMLAATAFSVLILSFAVAPSHAREGKTAAVQPASSSPSVERVQDCSRFADPYHYRGFGWGSGPDSSLGFGTFEGALPSYPMNSFPNWYGLCENWGHYSATGSAPR
jgi:hypothetical protein